MIINNNVEKTLDCVLSIFIGLIFGLGLIISGMIQKTKVVGFLVLDRNCHPSLLFVLLSAVVLNFFTFYITINYLKSPWVVNTNLDIPKMTQINFKLLFGSTVFGIGWGLSGLFPGPVLVNLQVYLPHLPVFLLV